MARTSLILTYQWRAYWRRVARTRHGVQLYLTMLALLAWLFFVRLPRSLSLAADEMAADRTGVMDGVLVLVSGLWLFAAAGDANLTLTSRRLVRFPVDVGGLLRVRILSIFCSPAALLLSAGSLFALYPFLAARNTLFATVGAVLLFVATLGFGMTVSLLTGAAEWRSRLRAPIAVIAVSTGLLLFAEGQEAIREMSRDGAAFMPARLVTAVAVAQTLSAALVPLLALSAIGAFVWCMLVWSFRRSLYSDKPQRARRSLLPRFPRFPGRLGGLVAKEQQYFRGALDLWPGLLVVLAASAASLFAGASPLVRQLAIVIALALNTNLFINAFGFDRPAELNRYLILPVRGREILFSKNLALTLLVAPLLALLILSGWRSGFAELGAELVLAAVVLLSHFAWGNLASVVTPFRMQFYQLASSGAPITVLIGMAIGSIPGLAVITLLDSDLSHRAAAIAAILVATMAAYVGTLHSAGSSFEHRVQVISDRLA